MPADLPATMTTRALLEEQPKLSRAANPRALEELVAQERARQDGRLAVLRRLREEAERVLGAPPDSRGSPGIGARLRTLLQRRRARGPTHEHELRTRYEAAQLRARRAVTFAETLTELSQELGAENERLRSLLADLERDDSALDDLIRRLRACDDQGDPISRRAHELEGQRDAVRAAEDRLLRLLESERMLAARVDALRDDVARSSRRAGERLDEAGALLRSLATRDDSAQVLADLDRALVELLGALDDSARRMVDEREGS